MIMQRRLSTSSVPNESDEFVSIFLLIRIDVDDSFGSNVSQISVKSDILLKYPSNPAS